MGYMIITKNKKEKMSDLVEEMLYAGGRLMHCLEELSEEDSEMNERDGGRYAMRSYGSRSSMGNRSNIGYRNDDMVDDEIMERRYRRR